MDREKSSLSLEQQEDEGKGVLNGDSRDIANGSSHAGGSPGDWLAARKEKSKKRKQLLALQVRLQTCLYTCACLEYVKGRLQALKL